jgi:hypothetical protein
MGFDGGVAIYEFKRPDASQTDDPSSLSLSLSLYLSLSLSLSNYLIFSPSHAMYLRD